MEWLTGLSWWGVVGLVFAALFLIWLLVRWIGGRESGDGADAYVKGLDALIHGDKVAAREYLRKAVRYDSDNVDAYLKLGTLYRETGDPNRAYTIHSELTVRSRLRKSQRIAIYKELAEDQWALGAREGAMDYAKSILRFDKRNTWVRDFKLRIYEEDEDWDRAARLMREMAEDEKDDRQNRLACYRIEQARQAFEHDKHEQAFALLDKAIKGAPGFPVPYILKGDILLVQDRETEAVEAWRIALATSPADAPVIYNRLEKVFFNQGRFDEMEAIYRRVLEAQPSHEETLFRLAEFYFKKGQREEAARLAGHIASQNGDSIDAMVALLRYSDENDRNERLSKLWAAVRKPIQYRCTVCGHIAEDLVWKCPGCHSWSSFTAK